MPAQLCVGERGPTDGYAVIDYSEPVAGFAEVVEMYLVGNME